MPCQQLSKLNSLLFALTFFAASQALCQVKPEYVRTDFQMGYGWLLKQAVNPIPDFAQESEVQDRKYFRAKVQSQQTTEADTHSLNTSAKSTTTSGYLVNVGRSFIGNHLNITTPSDNTLAISNDGLIVAVDNYSVAYFKENGDTIVQFGLPFYLFYNDSTFDRKPFDPRVIYDSYENRFILVCLYHSVDFTDSRILLSFSKPLVADTVEWSHYQLSCDSIFAGLEEAMYWFDLPNIAVSRSQLILTVGVGEYDSLTGNSPIRSNVVFQIDKSQGFLGGNPLTYHAWKGVANSEGKKDITIVPAMDALQSISYDTICYLVSNNSSGSDKFFWFELRGAANSPTSSLNSYLCNPRFAYNTPPYASQLGGQGRDRISIVDCDVQYCLYQNSKLHFVFTRSDNGWSELVYAQVQLPNGIFSSATLSGRTLSTNYLWPSIASTAMDSTEESFLIGFLRTGPNSFPEICAVHIDSAGWSNAITTVKTSNAWLDLREDLVAPWDSMERWGDYTAIQRRYNDPFRRCWMVGSYAFGFLPNHFGVISGLNAFIAELGDSLPANSLVSQFEPAKAILFPNPSLNTENINITFSKAEKGNILIQDVHGKAIASFSFSGTHVHFPQMPLEAGMYFVTIKSITGRHETHKLVILN